MHSLCTHYALTIHSLYTHYALITLTLLIGKVAAGLAAGNISIAMIDDSVVRILTPMFSVGVLDAKEGAYSVTKHSVNVSTPGEWAPSVASVHSVLDLYNVRLALTYYLHFVHLDPIH
jgi:hypothetical protein